ncbi:hypothetical protein CPB84DRAFT_1853244 [Gymnopilus junonius]|uniref:Uncharacterized protein n=1 Tax=Gymnopilus junonius TaxID=109634 RepID=A0A9P5N900_GYMJU|nr:hypothetical protein CPB84DRAFT_1853244 [Gymnopilus junonius]
MESRNANQIAAESAAASPTQTMIAPFPNEDKGKLYNHFDDFFMAREKRQAELLKVESVEDRVHRENHEQDRPLHNVYIWTKIWSSGGRDVYNCVRLHPGAKETEWSEHELYQKVYNAMANEWDLCEDFPSPFRNADEPDADLDNNEAPVGHPSNDGADSHQPLISTAELTTIVPMSLSDKTAGELSPPSYSHDILETLRLVYGYTPPLVDVSSSDKHDWHTLLHTLGFVSSLDELPLMDSNRHAITVFMDQIFNSSSILSDINDLDTSNYHPLHHLFKFNEVHHLSDKLLVFFGPCSSSCNWALGVESLDVALYVCRYILENPKAHTIVTVAHRLLQRGMRFHTVLSLPCSPQQVTISQCYKPLAYRFTNYKFTFHDFEAVMLNCQAVLSSPQGRAAVLQGGIIGCIAREYLSMDSALEGPSVEVTAHRAGFIAPSGAHGLSYCDDELTQNEIAIICGTYTLYTSTKGQVAVWSWFLPPDVWNQHHAGLRWSEWTEHCETWFMKLMENIRSGKSKPMSSTEWGSALRGFKLA